MATNAVPTYTQDSPQGIQDALGIPVFDTSTGTNYFQTISGLLIQGGLATAVPAAGNVVVPFPAGYPIQVLGVFAQLINAAPTAWSISAVGLTGFTLHNAAGVVKDFYWYSIGV